jgi:hypothetical protein
MKSGLANTRNVSARNLFRNQLKEINYRLFLPENREEQRTSDVDGLTIEHALRDLAEWCGAKKVSLSYVASAVNYSGFTQEQRRFLLELHL